MIDSFYPLSLASISLLFFFRVRAVYGRTRLVTGIFGLLWLGVLGSAITVPFGGAAISIGPTKYCLISEVDPYVGACAIMVTIHDTAVFLAISYRLVSNTYGVKTRKDLLKTLVSASYLPAFSRSLFVDGQVYYM